MTSTIEVILVAASGLAREVLSLVDQLAGISVIGLVDDDPMLHGTAIAGYPVLGPIQSIVDHPEAELVLCAGSGRARLAIADRIARSSVGARRYARIVDPNALVSTGCTVGEGSILMRGVVLTADVHLGAHVVVMPNVTLTHDNRIGDYATICAGVALGGNVEVQEQAYLGMSASIRQGVVVGKAATLGMGSVLLTDLPAGQTWAGCPAAPIRTHRLQEAHQ